MSKFDPYLMPHTMTDPVTGVTYGWPTLYKLHRDQRDEVRLMSRRLSELAEQAGIEHPSQKRKRKKKDAVAPEAPKAQEAVQGSPRRMTILLRRPEAPAVATAAPVVEPTSSSEGEISVTAKGIVQGFHKNGVYAFVHEIIAPGQKKRIFIMDRGDLKRGMHITFTADCRPGLKEPYWLADLITDGPYVEGVTYIRKQGES